MLPIDNGFFCTGDGIESLFVSFSGRVSSDMPTILMVSSAVGSIFTCSTGTGDPGTETFLVDVGVFCAEDGVDVCIHWFITIEYYYGDFGDVIVLLGIGVSFFFVGSPDSSKMCISSERPFSFLIFLT